MAAALILAGCAHKKHSAVYDEREGGEEAFVRPFARTSDLPPPKSQDPPPDPNEIAAPRSQVWAASPASARLAHSRPEPHESAPARAASEPLRPAASVMAAPGPAGPPPEKARAQGRPEVRRPDELTPLPTGRPARYASPAPLRKLLDKPRSEERPLDEVSPGNEEVAVDAAAAAAAFPPQSTAALADEVPDTTVAEPNEIGSYRVQVSTSPAFGPVLFDKLYPFMADIDLKSDLTAGKVKPGRYWLRYALVDLLGFEHPFTRPQRITLR